ncbi:MAG: methyltransferase domain-containing protein, partial [Acidobacteria bacterium]|nr:methyltransferase domain-containing protein [Acidobacteriota bacterium]
MEPERLEDRLERLEKERAEADSLYNERLTAVDAALLRLPEFPHPPPQYDEAQITPLNEAFTILPDGPPAIDGSLKGRLRGFIWRLIGPPLDRQQAFNAALVDHFNRNVAVHREAKLAITSTLELIQHQTTSIMHFQSSLLGLLQSLTLYVDTKDRSLGGQIHVLNAAISALADDWMKHWESQRVREDHFEAQHPALMRAYEELSQKVSLAQQTSLLLKREVERLLSTSAPAHQSTGAPEHQSTQTVDLNSFKYVGFEDRFRGSQTEIRARLEDYIPLFVGATRVIDLGCGRGELLDLFRESGVEAHGIDVNSSMVEVCLERGLSAETTDALGFLDRQPDQSLGGLIAIQVVEHLDPEYLSRLIELAFHKLAPGAPLVLETLNPACWVAFFESYIRDVTHRWPLHPETLHYMVQSSGFSTATIQYRSPVPDADKLQHVPLLSARGGKDHNPILVDLVDIVNTHAEKIN